MCASIFETSMEVIFASISGIIIANIWCKLRESLLGGFRAYFFLIRCSIFVFLPFL